MVLGEIHNLVRTYQRVLNLDPPEAKPADAPPAERKDRVSISSEARGLHKGQGGTGRSSQTAGRQESGGTTAY